MVWMPESGAADIALDLLRHAVVAPIDQVVACAGCVRGGAVSLDELAQKALPVTERNVHVPPELDLCPPLNVCTAYGIWKRCPVAQKLPV